MSKFEEEAAKHWVKDGKFGKLINPKSASIKLAMRFRVSREIVLEKVISGQRTRGDRVVDAFAGEGLDDAGDITDEQ